MPVPISIPIPVTIQKVSAIRFHALDGLRGICAIAVMLSHYSQFFCLNYLKNAGAAVDLFFVLSGLVIVHSYGNKIINGMSFREFITLRTIRLAPLNILGIVIACCALILISMRLSPQESISFAVATQASVLGAAFLPYFNTLQWPYGPSGETSGAFPLNLPAWSLFFEMLAYLVFFAYVARFRKFPNLIFCIFCYLTFLISACIFQDSNPGWSTDHFMLGVPRVMGGFFIGVIIYQIPTRFNLNNKFVPFILLCMIFYLFIYGGSAAMLFNALLIIPLLIWSMRAMEIKGKAQRICQLLGLISFPLYILHIPVATFLIQQKNILSSLNFSTQFIFMIIFILLISVVFGYIDMRFRNYLLAKFKPFS